MITLLENKLEKLNSELVQIAFPVDLERTVSSFIDSEIFDLVLYKKIYVELGIDCSIDKVEKYVNFLNSNIDSEIFESQIDKCKRTLLNIKSTISKKYDNYIKAKNQNESVNKKIEVCKAIIDLYNSNSIINLSQFDLSILELTLEEEVDLLFDISSNNAKALKLEYERILESAKKEKVVAIDEDLEELLRIAKEIVAENYTEPYNKVDALLFLNDDDSYELREDIYDCVSVENEKESNLELKISVIQFDLNEIIIPAILNNELSGDTAKDVLRSIINIYNKTKLDLEEKKNYIPSPEETLLKQMRYLMETTFQDLYMKGRYNYNPDIYTKIEGLAIALKEELDTINTDTKKIKISESLKEKYQALNDVLETVNKKDDSSKPTITDYTEVNPITSRNIFVFWNDEFLEEDMEYFKFSGRDERENLLQCIKKKSNEDFGKMKAHHSKTSNYSEKFIKKYHVRHLFDSKIRIYFSRFAANISEIFPECDKNAQLILVHKVGPGDVDSNVKGDGIEETYSRIYHNTETVDNIIDLFSTDWSKVTGEERIRRIDEISKILSAQQEIYKNLKGGELVQ